MTDRVAGKVVLITGAASGLGRATAERLAREGAKVVVSDIDEDGAHTLAQQICDNGGEAAGIALNVIKEEDWQRACDFSIEKFDGLDVLVNNAGIESVSLITDTSLDDFRQTQKLNVDGTFLGMKYAITAMRPDGAAGCGGSIVNISSIAGTRGFTGLNAYCASKGAVKLMTKAAAIECADLQYGIRVNSVHPGMIETELGANLLQQYVDIGLGPDYEAVKTGVIEKYYPNGFGSLDDVANMVLFLVSDESKWVTGAQFALDGGSTA